MIRILDTNALTYLYTNDLCVREEHACYVPTEIEEEFLSDLRREGWFKRNHFVKKHIDETDYLAAYAQFLNRYTGVSFYSLKGFGDVAILAVLTILVNEVPRTLPLSLDLFTQDSIHLVTDDRKLRNFVGRTFQSHIVIEQSTAFALML